MKLEREELNKIIELLSPIKDPEIGLSIVKLGMIESIEKEDNTIRIKAKLTVPGCPLSSTIEKDIKKILEDNGYKEVNVEFGFMSKDELDNVKSIVRKSRIAMPQSIERYEKKKIKKVIAVYSAKGGVGKSTTVKLLAETANSMNYRTGILDCDISGPSISTLFHLHEKAYADSNGKIIPIEKDNIKIIAVDMLTNAEAIIWRGPLVSSAIKQMYNDTLWEELDVLFLDLPPGTSDAPITVFQSIPVDGLVVVTTPQDLSNIIGKKTLVVAKSLNIPVIGVIENMSYFVCKKCGEINEIGSSQKDIGLPILAKLPFINDFESSNADISKQLKIAVGKIMTWNK